MKRLLTFVFLLTFTVRASADVDTAKVNDAVKKGADYLKGYHGPGVNTGGHGTGSVALTGMALLASGSNAKDDVIKNIATHLRPQVFTDNKTYNVALMALFFDKLGLPEDEGLIQILGVKLLAGQNQMGGWGYDTWPIGTALDGPKWFATLRNWKFDGRLHPEVAKLYATVRSGPGPGRGDMSDDNSNTQFALIAVWVCGKHAVPVRDAAAKLDNRFLRTQDPQSGGWAYSGIGSTTPSMTCAGLLGLAVAFGTKATSAAEMENQPKKKDKDDDDDPFAKPPPAGGTPKPEDKDAPQVADLAANRRKAAINRGLKALELILAGNRPQMGSIAGGFGSPGDLYFFWSVERVGVAFGLEKIGTVDWYEWGAPALLSAQAANGSWAGSHGDEVGTSFAILFLTRANFAVDLSAKLKGQGFGGELRGGQMIKAIPFAPQEAPKQEPGKPPPKISGIREITQADGLADALIGVAEADFEKKLKEYQLAKGEQYTAAITYSINRLERDRQKLARQALVDRLVRMTPETLKKMTSVNEPELRRAAILACASKDDKTHVPDLINRINDPDEDVIKAARVGLRSLTGGTDFGPNPGASEDEKTEVSIKWRHWLSAKGAKGLN